MGIFRGFISLKYIFFELLPSFILSNLVFVFIILMFQGLRFTEFALVHQVSPLTLVKMLGFMTVSFLPILLPMSLLLSILLTYSRLSTDSEIVALKSVGQSLISIMLPALLLALLTMMVSAQMSFKIGPWGNRQFEVMVSRLMNAKASINLKQGTFLDGFFNMVVYAGDVNETTGELKNIFIYDDRVSPPLTIIAKTGLLKQDNSSGNLVVDLDLKSGNIHRKELSHTKIDFGAYKIKMKERFRLVESEKSLQSYTIDELKMVKDEPKLSPKQKTAFTAEYYKRWSIAGLCLVFALLGVGLGTFTNRRANKGGGIALAILIIVMYWILFVAFESAARQGSLPPVIAAWSPNLIFSGIALWALKRSWN